MAVDLEAFRKNYLVVGLSDSAIAEVAALAKEESKIPDDYLIRLNDKDSDLLVILAGRVLIQTAQGERLAEIGPGGVLGEIALIDDQPRSATAVCISQVRVARIPAQALRSLMNTKREMGFVILANLAKVLCQRLRSASVRLDHLMNNDVWKGSF